MSEIQRKILSSKEKGIGRLVFNNPERRNAMSLEMWKTTTEVLQKFNEDPDVLVIVLSGAGGKAFVSGADISKFESERASVEDTVHYNESTAAAIKILHHSEKPSIAMIRGFCMGGGLTLSLSCDLRFCTSDSFFGLPAAKLGVGYSFDGIRLLTEIVGPANAREICFTGNRFSAEEALQMKLVNRIYPTTEIEGFVDECATVIAGNAPLTLAAMKQIFIELSKDPEVRDLERCRGKIERCFSSKDYVEGRKDFLEKRKPNFQGE